MAGESTQSNEVNNGISLCAFHHPLKINDEERLIPVFRELVLTVN